MVLLASYAYFREIKLVDIVMMTTENDICDIYAVYVFVLWLLSKNFVVIYAVYVFLLLRLSKFFLVDKLIA